MAESVPATDWQTIRDALDVLYHYTSDDANPPGDGRSSTRANGMAAVARLQHQHEQAQAVVDAARRAERKLWHEYRKGFDQGGPFPKVPDDESWAEGEALAAALARLDETPLEKLRREDPEAWAGGVGYPDE